MSVDSPYEREWSPEEDPVQVRPGDLVEHPVSGERYRVTRVHSTGMISLVRHVAVTSVAFREWKPASPGEQTGSKEGWDLVDAINQVS